MPASHRLIALLTIPLLIFICAGIARAQTTVFTYQGRLSDTGTPANGSYDLQLGLWDSLSAGTQLGTRTFCSVSVTNGSFTVQIAADAGAFPGADRFLEIGVRLSGSSTTCGSSSPYTVLSPRQQITSTPYAIRALNATNVLTPQVSVDGATGNVNTNGNVTTTGNVSAANVTTTGNVSAANVSAANVTASGGLSVTPPASGPVFAVDASGNVVTSGTLGQGFGVRTFSVNAGGNVHAGELFVGEKFHVDGSNGNVTTPGSIQAAGDVNAHFVNFVPGTGGSTPLCQNSSNIISTCSSSVRYKKNILNLGPGLDVVSRLRPITFKWKEGGQADLGLVAEEVNEVEPLLVTRNGKGEIEGVKYDRLSAVFINAFKEQQAQIQKQHEQIAQEQVVIGKQQEQVKREQALLHRQQEELDALKRLVCLSHLHARVCRSNNDLNHRP